MCGLTGFYDLGGKRSRAEMRVAGKAMSDALAHRGPDSDGIWVDEDIPLALGHRRLSILDLSSEGAQPMRSPSGRYVIIYNGEIYNHLELRGALESAGMEFRGRSDTETLLAAVEHWGLNLALQKIGGMFAFALWDRQERQLHFVRDRLGKKPLYIGWAGTSLVFGSELKALRAHPDFEPRVSRAAFALYMQSGYCRAPHSIYEGVWALPAGQRLSLDIEALEAGADLQAAMISYWDHGDILAQARSNPVQGDDEAVIREFEDLLQASVSERLISDVPLGAFLSGGIDSSCIAALMQKTAGDVKTYSIGFHEAGFDEAVYAKEIAAHLGTDHHELYVSAGDARDVIPDLPEIYDEPFADISAIPTYLVSRFARGDVTVALSGDGGDEMLGGYARHIEGPKIWKGMKRIPRPLRKGLARFIRSLGTEKWDALNRKHPQFGMRMHKAAGMLSKDTQEAVYARLLSQWDAVPVLDAPAGFDSETPEGLSFAEQMMFCDARSYLPDDILTKVDRASMAVSLEARAPLLDKRIYEYVWRLPARFKIRDGKGKWLLRQVLARHVPREMFERPKQGFNMPVGDWLRGDLKDWAENLLDEQRLKEDGFFDAAAIRESWDAHQKGEGNYADGLWSALMFQAWQNRWL